VIDFIEDNHDLIMGAALMIAAVLTVVAIRKPSARVKTFALVGAAVTFVIGALLFLGLA
jgi:membrane associated rhomboid family serine protease